MGICYVKGQPPSPGINQKQLKLDEIQIEKEVSLANCLNNILIIIK